MRVLSEDDWTHWTTKGFVIVRQAVPQANVERLAKVLWEFDEKDPGDPSTWYAPQRREHKMKELNNTGMVEIYNHQALWDNRMEQRVYDVFVDIWDENIEMDPGDLLIFNSLLAHGVRPNHSDNRPRMAQYISMHPAEPDNQAERTERIRLWQEQDHPQRDAFPGDPRGWEKANTSVAALNELGEKLLGARDW